VKDQEPTEKYQQQACRITPPKKVGCRKFGAKQLRRLKISPLRGNILLSSAAPKKIYAVICPNRAWLQ
jgi:hypothetical protein